MDRAMIALRDVRFAYGKRPAALHCDALDIEAGLTLLLGPNGAGKSTLLKILAGVEHPTSGTVTVDGFDLWKREAAARRLIAYIPEQPDLSPYATLGDIMRLVCALRDAPIVDGERALAQVGLDALRDRTVRELSMGQRRRAMLAAALVGNPRVLLFDEPLESMDQAMREWLVGWIAQRLAVGAAVVVATHDVAPFASMAQRAIVVEAGTLRIFSPWTATKSRPPTTPTP